MKPSVLLLILVGARAGCPKSPTGFEIFPAHCIGYPSRGKNCAVEHHVGVGHGSCAKNLTVTACVAAIATKCKSTPGCYSFSLRVSGALCTEHDHQSINFQLFNIGGNGSTVSNDDWLSFTMPNSPTPPPPPAPPAPHPNPNPAGIPAHSDCAIRRLALEFADQILDKSLNVMPVVFDGLELGTRCNDTRPTLRGDASGATKKSSAFANPIFVDTKGSDKNPGTLDKPVQTVQAGLELLRAMHLPPRTPRSLVLRSGTHYMNATAVIGPEDSGLHIMNYPADKDMAWLSGAVPLANLHWERVASQPPGANIFRADLRASLGISHKDHPASKVSHHGQNTISPSLAFNAESILAQSLEDLHSLRLRGVRATAARWPNARIELDRFPTGYAKAKVSGDGGVRAFAMVSLACMRAVVVAPQVLSDGRPSGEAGLAQSRQHQQQLAALHGGMPSHRAHTVGQRLSCLSR